jgi:putative hydrolase of the HAD superfamily
MDILLKPNTHFIFDLDDTLYSEVDFLKSAFQHIGIQLQGDLNTNITQEMLDLYYSKANVFESVVNKYGSTIQDLSISMLLKMYREHLPDIKLSKEVRKFLKELTSRNILSGLITDGRSVTQRNKLKALELANYFEDVIISEEFGSEKPDPRNFLYFEKKYPNKEFWFVADNTSKDFIVPSKLEWNLVCVIDNNNKNVHFQNFKQDSLAKAHLISSFNDMVLK